MVLVGWRQPGEWCCSGPEWVVCLWPDPFLRRITALMGSVVAFLSTHPVGIILFVSWVRSIWSQALVRVAPLPQRLRCARRLIIVLIAASTTSSVRQTDL